MSAINEILPKATGVGKVDPNSDGTGEIFNTYEGNSTNVASGVSSHAEGYGTTAEGRYSHAEGAYAHARGVSSHAEGSSTNATGNNSHAEGSSTNAEGSNSHAEGTYTQTFSSSEHAEGYSNKSYDSKDPSVRVIHSVGIGSSNSNRKNAHEIKFNGDHYIYGLGGFDGTNSADAQTLQEVINGKQDTLVSGTSIKTINGESLLGSGDIEITVTPDLSDYQTKSDDTLNTTNKTVVGAINEIENRTLNLSTQYPSDGATLTVGTSNEPLTRIDFHRPKPAFELKGPSVLASPNSPLKYRFALGDPKTTWTEYITLQNQTDDSLQTTNKTIAGAINEISSKATGVGKIDSTSDGTGEIFNGYEGSYANVASGNYSHAEGSKNNASGNYSHAEGQGTTASGYFSHAEGGGTTASGHNSHAEGAYTQTFSEGEHAEGLFNKSYDSTDSPVRVIHSVGIGSADFYRKNAHEIKFNGDHYIYGVGGYDGTNPDTAQSLQTVLSNLGPNIIEVPELTDAYNIPANATMVEKIYMITIGATVYNVTGDSAIKWAGGVTPTTSANSILVVSVLNNLATWQTFI